MRMTRHLHSQSLTARYASIIALLAAFVGCAGQTRIADCASSPTAICVAELANAERSSVATGTAQVSAAIEVALAQAAAGDAETAAQTLAAVTPFAAALDDSTERAVELTALASTAATLQDKQWLETWLATATTSAASVTTASKRNDLTSKLAVASAALDHQAALDAVLKLPEVDSTDAAYKARALAELAPVFAAGGDWSLAERALEAATMGLLYYRSVGYTRIARLAPDASQQRRYLRTAVGIARKLDDGYFKAGALRQAAAAYIALGNNATGKRFYNDAAVAAVTASTAERRARATSRIATSLADDGNYLEAAALLPISLLALESEERETMRLWSYYEIAGSAAFAGDDALATELIERIPPETAFGGSPLQPAAVRDLAFGLARHGETSRAIRVAAAIESPRERVQALARIARVLADPDMASLPRYL